jgi:dihydroxyacetone kinase-like predicted kinase
VVGGPGAAKVHLHTDEPGRALAVGTAVGAVGEVDIKNMQVQAVERTERLTATQAVSGAVAVCTGEGLRRLFESLGARCVDGGPTMNPSTADLLHALEALGEEEAVLLPNSKNVVLAAEQAAAQSEKEVALVPTRFLQTGLAALVAFDPLRRAGENAAEMEEAVAGVRAGAVARATRSASLGGVEVEEGQFLGLVEGEPVTAGAALEPVAREVVERLLGNAASVLTILVGEEGEAPEPLVADLRTAHDGLEIEVYEGGQPHYPLLFSVE